MAASEASSRAGPAGEESAGGVAGGAPRWPGVQVWPGLMETPCLGSPGLPGAGMGKGRDVWRRVPPASPGEQGRPTLLAPPPNPCLELRIGGAWRADLSALLAPGWGGRLSPPRGPGPADCGWGAESPPSYVKILHRAAGSVQHLISFIHTPHRRSATCAPGTVLGAGDWLGTWKGTPCPLEGCRKQIGKYYQ